MAAYPSGSQRSEGFLDSLAAMGVPVVSSRGRSPVVVLIVEFEPPPRSTGNAMTAVPAIRTPAATTAATTFIEEIWTRPTGTLGTATDE